MNAEELEEITFGIKLDKTKCIEQVPDGEDAQGNLKLRQCKKNRGHGKDGLYCKQHSELHKEELG